MMRFFFAAAISFVLIGCGRSSDDTRFPRLTLDPRLQHLETILLEESDEAAVGSPRSLWVTEDRFFVADRFLGQVQVFDREGQYLGRIGGRGLAPWEFGTVGEVIVSEDHVLVQDDFSNKVAVFRRDDLTFVQQYQLPFTIGSGWPISADTLLLGLLDREGGWTMGLLQVSDGEFQQFGGLPSVYRENREYALIFNGVKVTLTPVGDVLWGMSGLNELYVTPLTPGFVGDPTDTISVPITKRHGVPADLSTWIQEVSTREYLPSISGLFGLHPVPNGWVAIHGDQEIAEEGRIWTSTAFVTVFDQAVQHSCSDMVVRESDAGLAYFFVRGDTLFGIDVVAKPAPEMVGTDFSSWLLPDPTTCPEIEERGGE